MAAGGLGGGMALRDGVFAAVAGQLGGPSGAVGWAVGRVLNRANTRLVMAAIEAAGVTLGSEVADVGFGGGAGLAILLDQVGESGVVHGVEISDVMLGAARRRFRRQVASGRLRLDEAPMERLVLPDSSVDVVVSTNTIYFVDDFGAALAELERVLRPAGRLVLGVDDPDAMARMPFTKHGFTLRPVSEIVALVRRAGFLLVEDRGLEGEAAPHVIIGVKGG